MQDHLIKDQDAHAIIAGRHGDPFAVLGPHITAKGVVLRCFLPHARQVFALTDGRQVELARVYGDGLFAGLFPQLSDYQIKVITHNGGIEVFDDPYGFGPVLGEMDVYLLAEGRHYQSYDKLGAHALVKDGVKGFAFAVWAPNASRVSVVGDFNNWDGRRHSMRHLMGCGVWEIFIPGLRKDAVYKYEILDGAGNLLPLKADPYGLYAQVPPANASKLWEFSDYHWQDAKWMEKRQQAADRHQPISIYEVHLGSWRRVPEEGGRSLTYLELADQLSAYVKEMGFTHVELLPVHEHPFSGSWGYQPIGLFAPTSRFGNPDEFRQFVDRMHQNDVGVIIDWVAGHFPTDAHGLGQFDGTHLYEHADPRLGFHKDWNTLIFNYGRREVVNYLISNALFWLDKFHIDGLRVDAVASMLYLDYSRNAGEWIPNRFGGRENLEAIDFLREMNTQVYGRFPGAMTIAEESTAWPKVSRPVYDGGLGFGYKWNMGWMNDTLRYMSKDPVYRAYHQDQLTFGLLYAFSENFVLPLSHDEVVHGKGTIWSRMIGDTWQKFANLRAYYGFMWTHPGKKLLFMGQEFGQAREWNPDISLDWHLLADGHHAGIQSWVRDLNHAYRNIPALHEKDAEDDGFRWMDCEDRASSVLAYIRKGADGHSMALVVCNFTPALRHDYRIGVPQPGFWREVLNSDSHHYGGSNVHNNGGVEAEGIAWHGQGQSVNLTLPPLSTIVFTLEK